MARYCFRHDCKLEAHYVCLCLFCETYCCGIHLVQHLKLPFRSHFFDSILEEPYKWTKDAILAFLAIESSKKEKLKKIISTSFGQNIDYFENNIEESLKMLDYLKQIIGLIEKIPEISESFSNQFNVQPNAGRVLSLLSECVEPYRSFQIYCILSQLRKKKFEILNKANNDPETENEFRRTCLLYENYASDPLINQALQEYINAYKNASSLYLISKDSFDLFAYDTEAEKEVKKEFKNIKDKRLILLSSCETFLNSSTYCSMINLNYQCLSQPYRKWWRGASIYFNRSVYFFGGKDAKYSARFDLDENRWIKLVQAPHIYKDDSCIVFNGNIVITRRWNSTLLLYTLDIDSFSEINHDNWISEGKILINAEERLYLIETIKYGCVYESGDAYTWKAIEKSIIQYPVSQVSCSYNKGAIFISVMYWRQADKVRQYFKFDLAQKVLVEVSYYDTHAALRKSGNNLEVIKCYDQTFELNPDHAEIYIDKKYSLYDLGHHLNTIEVESEKIKNSSGKYIADSINNKGYSLSFLKRNIEAIECFNRAIELYNGDESAYLWKGEALYNLGRNFEAIECYNKIIDIYDKRGSWYEGKDISNWFCMYNHGPYFNSIMGKAHAFHGLDRDIEAIECYDILIKLSELKEWVNYDGGSDEGLSYEDAYFEKANILCGMGKTFEALEWYNKANLKNFNRSRFWIGEGNALHELKRDEEALECYDAAINIHTNNFLYFCYRANVLNNLGIEAEAIKDFNRAHDLLYKQRFNNRQGHSEEDNDASIDEELVQNCIAFLKMLCDLEEGVIKFKEELKKLKVESSEKPEIISVIEEKEATVKAQHSQLLKRSIECLDSSKFMSKEAIQQTENEVIEYHKSIIDSVSKLLSLIAEMQKGR